MRPHLLQAVVQANLDVVAGVDVYSYIGLAVKYTNGEQLNGTLRVAGMVEFRI